MIAPASIPSVFDNYNAKWLSPSEVARSFIPPPQFGQLVKRTNSLIVGPRGSGKTTLLKMLTEPARDAWYGSTAARYAKRIDYTGVFIATDVAWSAQVNGLADQRIEKEAQHLLQLAALTAHAHKALVDAMEVRAKCLLDSTATSCTKREATLSLELAELWRLEPRVPSYYSLKAAIRRRLQQIFELATTIKRLSPAEQLSHLDQNPYLKLPLIISCRNAVEQFNDAYGHSDHFWALLFDEVELMPSTIRNELMQYLRTLPDRIIFKLALFPFDEENPAVTTPAHAQRDHDYDLIPLWFARKRRAYRFCASLWSDMVRGTAFEGKTSREVLGQSLLNTDSDDWKDRGTAYTNGSPHHKYILELCTRDKSFRRYLREHDIDAQNIQAVRGTERASTLRKVFPLVVARVEHAKAVSGAASDEEQSRLRSRKISMIYTGEASLFDICEGNPRVFKGLVNRLLERLPDKGRLGRDVQADEITQATSRFRALLRIIVLPRARRNEFPRGLLSLLDPIAKNFQYDALLAPFAAEPRGSFVVDSRTGDDDVRMVGYAMNAGAIVYVPSKEGDEELLSVERIRGKRFRLSYLYAAKYGIVPRLGRAVSLRELRRVVPRDESLLFDGEKV